MPSKVYKPQKFTSAVVNITAPTPKTIIPRVPVMVFVKNKMAARAAISMRMALSNNPMLRFIFLIFNFYNVTSKAPNMFI